MEKECIIGEGNCKKLRLLWLDKRSRTRRLLIAGVTIFCSCFTFVFFGPLEMVTFNSSSLVFEYRDVAALLGISGFVLFVLLTLLVWCFKGRVFDYIVTMIFSLTCCGYIQGMFLNGELGTLTGDALDWPLFKKDLVVNTFIWILIVILVFLALYLSRRTWETIVLYVSIGLTIMQSVPCIAIFGGAYNNTMAANLGEYWLSTEGLCEYSTEDNVLVFVLDRLDYDYIEEVLAYDASFFDPLDGFIGYTDAISTYARTLPALNHILTGYEEEAYKIPTEEYFAKSWTANGKNILRDLSRQGYDIGIYTKISSMFGNGAFAEEYVANVVREEKVYDYPLLLKKLLYFSAYRYLPIACKPFFWSDTNYYNTDVILESEGGEYNLYSVDESKYIEQFENINVQSNDKCFKLYHFMGSHSPYYMREDGTRSNESTSSREQTMGSFNILYRIFGRMKELGIYDDATIIITADHGTSLSDHDDVLKPTRIGLFYKPSGSSGTPLVYSAASVSTQNIPATIMKAVGSEYSHYGIPIDEIGENDDIVRVYYKSVVLTGHEGVLCTYEIRGEAAEFENWVVVKTEEIEYPFY